MRIKNAFAILAISIAALAVSAPAQAAVTIDIQEVGPDVVATTSGSIDLTGLTYAGTGGSIAGVIPSGGLFASTSPVSGFDTYYSIAGPAGFGT